MNRRTLERASPLIVLALVLLLWQAIVTLFAVPEFIFPSPLQITREFVEFKQPLLEAAWKTFWVTMLGFGVSIAVGVLLGFLVGSSRLAYTALYPLMVAFNAVPKVALAPLVLIWFGYGRTPILAMAFMVCFFPIVLSTATGLSSTPADLAELVRSMDASRWQTFVRVRLPAALPQIFVGLKVAMPLAVIGVVVGEMQYGESGLGTIIVQTSGQGDTATAFAAITLLALVSIVLYYALVAIERLALPWVRATTSQR
jgi:NitT/TauT family transport system permease protein